MRWCWPPQDWIASAAPSGCTSASPSTSSAPRRARARWRWRRARRATRVFAEPERDEYVRRAVAALDHPETRFSVEAERTVLDALGGGCQIPIGVHCSPMREGDDRSRGSIHAQVLAPDGESMIALTSTAPVGVDAETLGAQVADDLKARGALELLEGV